MCYCYILDIFPVLLDLYCTLQCSLTLTVDVPVLLLHQFHAQSLTPSGYAHIISTNQFTVHLFFSQSTNLVVVLPNIHNHSVPAQKRSISWKVEQLLFRCPFVPPPVSGINWMEFPSRIQIWNSFLNSNILFSVNETCNSTVPSPSPSLSL